MHEAGYSYAMITSMTRLETDLDKAVQLINEAVTQAATGGPRTTGTGIPVGEGMEKIEFRVQSTIVGHLIGKGGSTIQGIQKQAGCQVGIDQASPDAPESVVVIGPGSIEQCQIAEKLVMEKVAEKQRSMAAQAAAAAATPAAGRVGMGPGLGAGAASILGARPPGGPKVVMPTRMVEGGFPGILGGAGASMGGGAAAGGSGGCGPGGPLPVGRVISPTFPTLGGPPPHLAGIDFTKPLSGSMPTKPAGFPSANGSLL